MDEITPDMVASVANRLFRESSHSTSVPAYGVATPAHAPAPTAGAAAGQPSPSTLPHPSSRRVDPAAAVFWAVRNALRVRRGGRSGSAAPCAAAPEQLADVVVADPGFLPQNRDRRVADAKRAERFAEGIRLLDPRCRRSAHGHESYGSFFPRWPTRLRLSDTLRRHTEVVEPVHRGAYSRTIPQGHRRPESTTYASRPFDVNAIRRDFPILQSTSTAGR